MLHIVDIERVASIAHDRGAMCVVDNTFATPYLQQPLSLGADAVVHSSTKYLGGHSDVVGGFVATSTTTSSPPISRFMQNATGAVPSPFDCYLVQRGLKTLAVRMDRQCENAAAVAGHLAAHGSVRRVLYPGLESHAGTRCRVTADARLRGDGLLHARAAARQRRSRLRQKMEVFTLAESLGAVESLVEHPARMTHASVAGSELSVDPGASPVVRGPRDSERPAPGPRSRPRRRGERRIVSRPAYSRPAYSRSATRRPSSSSITFCASFLGATRV